MPKKKSDAPTVDPRDHDQAVREGREAAMDQYPQATIPIKYHSKKELGEIWYNAFMGAYNERIAK